MCVRYCLYFKFSFHISPQVHKTYISYISAMTMSGSTNNTTSGPGSGNHGNSGPGGGGTKEEDSFVEVWAKNLEEEFAKIRQIVQKYPYVSMVR